jgi:hypothetical protein
MPNQQKRALSGIARAEGHGVTTERENMKYPVYHAHKDSYQLKSKKLARFLAVPVFFTFLGFALCAVAANRVIIEQRAQADNEAKNAIMDAPEPEVLPPPVL